MKTKKHLNPVSRLSRWLAVLAMLVFCTGQSSFAQMKVASNVKSGTGALLYNLYSNGTARVSMPNTTNRSERTIVNKLVYDGDEYTVVGIESGCFSTSTNSAYSSYITELTVLANLQSSYVPTDAFSALVNLTTLKWLPTNDAPIYKRYGFYKLSNFTTLELRGSAGMNAFLNSPSLKTVSFTGGSNSYLAKGAFQGCSALETFSFGNGIRYNSSSNTTPFGDCVFSGCSSLTSIDMSSCSFASGIVPTQFFYGCSSMESCKLPYGVTTIMSQAFKGCSKLKSMTFPSTLKTLKNSAFFGCGFEDIDLSNTQVTQISDSCFWENGSAVSLKFPSALTSIGKYSFGRCSSLKNLDFPSSLVSIGEYAFRNCGINTTISLPASVSELGKAAFYYCSYAAGIDIKKTKITNLPDSVFCHCGYNYAGTQSPVVFPATLKSVGARAFQETKISTVQFASNVYPTFGKYAFYSSSITSIDLRGFPSSVTETCGLFERCNKLETVYLPTSCEVLGEQFFCGCDKLSTITGLENVVSIGDYAFASSSSPLYFVSNFSKKLKHIGKKAFSDCYKLTAFPTGGLSNLETIGDGAFYNSGIKSFVWPKSVAVIGSYVFSKSDLTDITIKGIQSVQDYETYNYPFTDCNLMYIHIDSDVKNIGSLFKDASFPTKAVIVCLSKNLSFNSDCFTKSTSRSVYVPLSFTTDENVVNTWSDYRSIRALGPQKLTCYGVTGSNEYYEVSNINVYRDVPYEFSLSRSPYDRDQNVYFTVNGSSQLNKFKNYSATPSFDIEEGTGKEFALIGEKEGTYVLECKAVNLAHDYRRTTGATLTLNVHVYDVTSVKLSEESVVIPFGGTVQLQSSVYPTAASEKGKWSVIEGIGKVTVDQTGLVTAQQSGDAVVQFETPNGKKAVCNVTVTPLLSLDKYNLLLKPGETGKVSGTPSTGLTFKSSDTSVATVDANGNVTGVGEGRAVVSVKSSQDSGTWIECIVVVSKDDYMYVGNIYYMKNGGNTVKVTNTGLSNTINYVEKERDEYAATVSVPSSISYEGKTYSVTEIGDYAFYRMKDLQQVIVPASVTSIGNRAFEGSKNLVRVTFTTGSKLKEIGFNACKDCVKLDNVKVPSGVTSIGTAAFMNCTGMTSLTFNYANLTEVSDDMCRNCEVLDGLNLPSSIKVIGKNAFRDCKALSTLSYPTLLSMIDENAFHGCAALTSVSLPDKVASLQNNAYEACNKLQSVVLPATLEGIGAESFKDCSALTSIQFQNTQPISIGEDAFIGCTNMNKVTVADLCAWAQTYFANEAANPLSMAKHLYQGSTELKSVSLPSTTQYVGQYAFAGGSSISTLTLPANVKAISDGIAPSTTTISKTASTLDLSSRTSGITLNRTSVFLMPGETVNLTAVGATSPSWSSSSSSVATVSSGKVIAVAAGTAEITVSAGGNTAKCVVVVGAQKPVYVGAMYYTLTDDGNAIVNNLEQSSGALYTTTLDHTEYSGIVNIPASVTYKGVKYTVTEVSSQAFYKMEHLQKAIIPADVTAIGARAFESSENLARVEFAGTSTCKSIAMRAFYDCDKLDQVVLPSQLTIINKETFCKSDALKSITLPANLTTIDEYAFAECKALADVTLPGKVASLQKNAFKDCTALQSMVFPASLEGIGAHCFNGCTKLSAVEFKNTKPISIGGDAFLTTGLTKVTVASLAAWVQSHFVSRYSNPTAVAHSLYVGTTKQSGKVTVSGASYVNQYALTGCTDITGLTLPNSVKAYSDYVLQDCGGNAVAKTDVTLDLSSRSTTDMDCQTIVLTPGEEYSLGTYSSCTSSNTSVATVSSAGKITAVAQGTAVITVTDAGKTGKCMVVVSSVPVVYVGGFYYKLNSDNTATLTNAADGIVAFGTDRYEYAGIINVPSTVTYDGKTYTVNGIGTSAFYKMAHLQKVIVPATVTTIGGQAFEASKKMKRIEFTTGSKVKSILTRAFYECETLDEVTVPEGVTTIDESVFRYCKALQNITLPSKLSTINEYAFANCTKLAQITLPSTLAAVQDYAFASDAALSSITIPEAMQGIGKYTFQNCTAMSKIRFKNTGVMTVGENAFDGCTGLKMTTVDNLAPWVMTNFGNEKANPLYYANTIGQEEGKELMSIKVPSTATYVNQFVFVNCKKLTKVEFPSTIETISDYVFLGCSALTDVICKATAVPAFIGTRELSELKSKAVFEKATLYVPEASVSKYQGNSYWKLYHAIKSVGSIVVGDVDRNGIVNMDDLTLLKGIVLGKLPTVSAADVNDDGHVGVGDVSELVKKLNAIKK